MNRGAGPTRRLVFASGNAGKLREIRTLLGAVWDVVPQADFGIDSIAETGTSFRENALLKARHAADRTGLPALADDSGLEVDALGGAPGIRSARFAGPAATDQENNQALLAALAGTGPADRGARFRCVLAFVAGPDDPVPRFAEGVWEGAIAEAPRGTHGFGYDPLFLDGYSGLSAAELSPADKNLCSHRAKALTQLVKRLLDT